MRNYAKQCWITLLEIKELMQDFRKVNNKESFPAWPFPDKIEPGTWPFPTSQPKEGSVKEFESVKAARVLAEKQLEYYNSMMKAKNES